MDKYVDVITSRIRCTKHHADLYEPCWFIYPDMKVSKGLLEAVCGPRAKKAGFVGVSHPASLRAKSIRRTKQN